MIDGAPSGRIGVIDLALRRRIDDHLGAWAMIWAELHLSQLAELSRKPERLGTIPPFPLVEMDFTLAVPRSERYSRVSAELARFQHPHLRSIRFLTSFEGEKSGGARSLTFRCVLGDSDRTLADADTSAFRSAFEGHASRCGFELKKA
jgi:phenylalanyl-tRNA synthetase beta subunit